MNPLLQIKILPQYYLLNLIKREGFGEVAEDFLFAVDGDLLAGEFGELGGVREAVDTGHVGEGGFELVLGEGRGFRFNRGDSADVGFGWEYFLLHNRLLLVL